MPEESKLHSIILNWVQSMDANKVNLLKEKNKYIITPVNQSATKITLWESDRKKYIGLSAGKFSWWADNIKLEREVICSILSSIANGHFYEREHFLGNIKLDCIGIIEMGTLNNYKYRKVGLIPSFIGRWETLNYEAF